MQPIRRAFTLLEMVLVLALIVLLAALSYPSFEGMLADQRLTSAEDMIRGECARARARAINEGVPYRFAYVPNSGNWRIAPDSDDFWTGDGTSSASSNSDQPPPLTSAGALPRGIRFVAGVGDGGAGPDSTADASSVSITDYTRLVVFLPNGSAQVYPPDGSTSDYLEITLKGTIPGGIVIKIRGLTGTLTTRTLDQ